MLQPPVLSFPRPAAVTPGGAATLDVCTMISNPVRYSSRYRLFHQFRSQNEGPHIRHWTVEVAYGNRPFAVTEADNPRHLQLRTSTELWHKENALNLLFAHVLRHQPDAEYFAWVDADVTFARPDWAYETIQQLQHYQVVQMFSHCVDLGPRYEPAGPLRNSFVWMYYNEPRPEPVASQGAMRTAGGGYGYTKAGYWHPGFAWAARRSALDALGCLLDHCIVGSADWHMAACLIGEGEKTISRQLHPHYKREVLAWQDRANAHIRGNIGYVEGLLAHHWHGRKVDRHYTDRWRILVDNGFDPVADLKRDAQGLLQLTERNRGLRDGIRTYFRSRNEDSIDLV